MLYFDHNATSPLCSEAREAWLQANDALIGNPSSPHRLGHRADAALGRAREQLATFLGCHALDIVWTSGATESNNLVLHHYAQSLPSDAPVWVSALEHPSVLEPAKFFFQKRLAPVPALRSGAIDLEWLQSRLPDHRPGLIVLMAANNETGVLQPWREVLALCRKFTIPFFCDATQWVGKLPAASLGEIDFVSGSGHKFGGPKGAGFLKCPEGVVRPLLRGGSQEENRRAGTENVPGVLAMMAALEVREKALAAGALAKKLALRDAFERQMTNSLRGAEVVGESANRLWNTVSALMPETDCQQRWVVKLDKAGFAVSTGSACASGREEPSHILRAMGYKPRQAARVLRFSSGWETRPENWTALAEALVQVHHQLQK